MITVRDIYEFIDRIAPFKLQESYDNSGLVIGSPDREVTTVLTALDVTREIIADAKRLGAELIVTHHPVIFDPVKRISFDTVAGELALSGISVISAHTSFDSAVMNDILCKKLGLVPAEPLCVENGVPIGCICDCEELFAGELAARIADALGNTCIRYNETGKLLRRVAVCSGSGGSFLSCALNKGADCLITGDVKHNIFIDAHNSGFTVFDAGHFHTEEIFCGFMRDALAAEFPGLRAEIAPSERDVLVYYIKDR